MAKTPRKIDPEFVRKGAEKIEEKDIARAVEKSDRILKRIGKSGPMGRFFEDAHLLVNMVKDYWHGRYREVPYWALAAIVFTLLYILDPLDLIPDFIPFFGAVDDAAVLAACLYLVERELRKYGQWKLENPD
ncbi:MAG: DUF1232 domain-containing protein [Acidobacteriota bacterium]